MQFKNLLLEISEGVAVLTINRPDKLNALNNETMEELRQAFEHLRENDEAKVVILTGAGEKAFVAGADISEIRQLDEATGKEFSLRGHKILTQIETLEKPVIAAVNGFALGGGCELAMACHIRLASENAKFGQPEVKLGIIPGYGGTVRLPRLVGKGKALQMTLTGLPISAKDAKCAGLVEEVYPPEELLPKAREMAKAIIANGPYAVKTVIRAVNEGLEMSLEQAKENEATLFAKTCATDDMKEGTSAFLEKRAPVFKGE